MIQHKHLVLTVVGLLIVASGFAQKYSGARMGFFAGLSTPVGAFSDSDNPLDESKGYATVGLDAGAFGDLFLTKHLSLGIRGGYTIYEVNESDMLLYLQEQRGESITLRTTPYQNLNLSGVLGYTAYLVEDKLDVNPYVAVGLSVFKTSDRRFTAIDSVGFQTWDYQLSSEIDPGLQLIPGLAVNYALMSFLDLRIYGEYAYANHRLEETSVTSTPGENTRLIKTRAVDYYLRAFSIGGGLSLRF
jgi:hypothetical protein